MLENNPDKEPSGTVNNGEAANTKEFKISLADTKNGKRKHNDNDFEDDEDLENKANGHDQSDDRQKEKVSFLSNLFGIKYEIISLQKKKLVEHKCGECNFKCYNSAELSTHQITTHGQKKRLKVCENCSYKSDNTWEMDFHCRSRGHKAKKDEGIPCKKCDYVADGKDDSWVHKKVHIPEDKLFECDDCVWCGDRLDNIRYHAITQVWANNNIVAIMMSIFNAGSQYEDGL